MIRRILLALGGTPFSRVSVERALEIAQARRAAVTAVPILDEDLWKSSLGAIMSATEAARIADSQPWAAAHERLERVIAELRHACKDAGIIHEVQGAGGQPFEQLVSQWRYHDLLITGLRGLFDYPTVLVALIPIR